MSTLITGTLQQAVPRQVPKKDGTGVWTFYDLIIDGKKYQTSQAVFNQSVGLVGQQVLADVENQQRNGYDNWKTLSCTLASGTAVAATQAAGASQTMQVIEQAQQAQIAAGRDQEAAERARTASICRQTAAKSVGALLSGSGVSVDTFLDVCKRVAIWMETGADARADAREQAIVSQVQSMVDPLLNPDDDIPF